jgi:hypothetical protein
MPRHRTIEGEVIDVTHRDVKPKGRYLRLVICLAVLLIFYWSFVQGIRAMFTHGSLHPTFIKENNCDSGK